MVGLPWDSSLPQSPQKDFQETIGINIVRSSMDSGPAKQRVRGKRPTQLSLSFIMTTAQTNTLESFILNTLKGTKRFDFTHPRTGAAIECRVVPQGDGEFYTLIYKAPGYWQANLKFEILP
jgi:hypothetical protein